jgi:hypothetical protein
MIRLHRRFSLRGPSWLRAQPLQRAELSLSRAEPSLSRAEPSLSRAEPSLSRAEPSLSRPEPPLLRAEPSLSRAEPSLSRAGPSLSRAGPSLLRAEPWSRRPRLLLSWASPPGGPSLEIAAANHPSGVHCAIRNSAASSPSGSPPKPTLTPSPCKEGSALTSRSI